MDEIAQRLGCSHSTLVYKFRKLNIKSRGHLGNTRPLGITKLGLIKQYERGLSLEKIARMFRCSKGGVERRFKKYGLVGRGLKNRASKYKKQNFSKNPLEKAYLIGFRLGDLNVYKYRNTIQIRCSTTRKAQVQLIRKLFSTYTTPYIWTAKRGTYEIVCMVNKSFNFLLPKEDKIPNWILDNYDYFLPFFAGYTDAEGSFYLKKPKKNSTVWSSCFEIQTQQKEIIFNSWRSLEKYRICSAFPSIARKAGHIQRSSGVINNKNMWRFSVTQKESLWKLIQLLKPYLRHQEKLRKTKIVEKNLLERGLAESYGDVSPT